MIVTGILINKDFDKLIADIEIGKHASYFPWKLTFKEQAEVEALPEKIAAEPETPTKSIEALIEAGSYQNALEIIEDLLNLEPSNQYAAETVGNLKSWIKTEEEIEQKLENNDYDGAIKLLEKLSLEIPMGERKEQLIIKLNEVKENWTKEIELLKRKLETTDDISEKLNTYDQLIRFAPPHLTDKLLQEKKDLIKKEKIKKKKIFSGADRILQIENNLKDHSKKWSSLYLFRDLSPQVRKNAKKKCKIPEEENPIGLIDISVFGCAKKCLVFGKRGIYYNNYWGSKNAGAHCLFYEHFIDCQFELVKKCKLSLGKNHSLNVSSLLGLKKDREKIVSLLNSIQDIIQKEISVDVGKLRRIKQVLRRNKNWDKLYYPKIPQGMMLTAKKKNNISKHEKILGLIDLSVWGSTKDCLVFGERGIYYHNYWGSKEPGNHYISYQEFKDYDFEFHGKQELSLGDNHFLNLSSFIGSKENRRRIVDILYSVKEVLLKKYGIQEEDKNE